MYPLFLWLQLVMVHIPTEKMYFYQCPNTGTVDYYYSQKDEILYGVEFTCHKGLKITVEFTEGQMRKVPK